MDSQIRAKSGRGIMSIPGISMDALMDNRFQSSLSPKDSRLVVGARLL